MEKLKHTAGIHGCVILSTCNRLEIWASHEEDQELSLYQCLCRLKGVQEVSYENILLHERIKRRQLTCLSGRRAEVSDSGRRPDSYSD